jgi:hypothetical protein
MVKSKTIRSNFYLFIIEKFTVNDKFFSSHNFLNGIQREIIELLNHLIEEIYFYQAKLFVNVIFSSEI